MKTTVSLLETNPNMEDKLDLLIAKLSKIEKEIEKSLKPKEDNISHEESPNVNGAVGTKLKTKSKFNER